MGKGCDVVSESYFPDSPKFSFMTVQYICPRVFYIFLTNKHCQVCRVRVAGQVSLLQHSFKYDSGRDVPCKNPVQEESPESVIN